MPEEQHPNDEERAALYDMYALIGQQIANSQAKLQVVERAYLLPGGQRLPILSFRAAFAKLIRGYRTMQTEIEKMLQPKDPFNG